MRRCRFCPHSVPVPGTTLRRPLQIYKKYPGFETKVTSFFSKPSVGRSLPSSPVRLLLSPFPVRFLVSPCRPLPSAFFCRFSRTLSRVALPPSPVRRVPISYIIPAKPGGNSVALREGSRPGRLLGYPFRSRCFDRNLRTGSSYSLRHSHARITEPKKSARAPGSDSRNVRSPFLTQA